MAQKISLDNFKAGQAGAQINVGLLGFMMKVEQTKVKVLTIYTVHQMIIILIN